MKRSLLLLCLALGLDALMTGCGQNTPATFKYDTTKATRGDLVQYVAATGLLSAVVSVDVGSQVSGKISALNADFNSPVKKGQLVAEIDPSTYMAAMHQAEGDLASAQAEATLKRQNLQRKKVLVPQRAATELDLDQAVAELAQAEAAVSIKQAALDKTKVDLGYCKITAPVDGIVISRKVDAGQTVAAVMTTPVLFTIAQDITKMHIIAAVSEADIGQVRDGQTVDFYVDAFPDEVFHGKVVQVRKAPTTTQNVVTYETVIDVDNPEQKLFPGMTANVSILVSERKNVTKVPNTGLRFTPPDGSKFEHPVPAKLQRSQRLAFRLGADGATLTPIVVKAGITDGVDSEILEGLADGDRVVISAIAEKKSGMFGGPPSR